MERELAKRIVKTHGTNNPWRIASERKTKVLFEDLGKDIYGYFTCICRIPSIHINARLSEPVKLFVGGHEIGHDLMHKGISTPFLKRHTLFSVNKIERQANRFALHLMIGLDFPDPEETKRDFLLRCGIPEEFHIFY
jgi:Zn-dependent peptidase ImmA (M78 family)